MRTKFLLTLCLAAMPMCMVGCESESGTQVGTGNGVAPPDVQQRIKEQEEKYRIMQEETSKNPTTSDGRGGGVPPDGVLSLLDST
ncbi:MAG: hypothetical protein ACK5PZ_02760 [Pirellula sp.]